MFGNLLGGLIDKDKMVSDTIQGSLQDIAEDNNFNHTQFCVMIKPVDDKMNFGLFLCPFSSENGVGKPIRTIPLSEILGGGDDENKKDS